MTKYGRPLLLVLALVALAASIASLYVHYQLIADPTYVSFCDVSETVSCEAVYKSCTGPPSACRWRREASSGRRSCSCSPPTACGRRRARPRAAPPATCSCCRWWGWPASSISPTRPSSCSQKACPLCIAVYASVVGIFIVSSAVAPAKLGSLLSGAGRDISGLMSSPGAMGLAAAWLLGSIALVALFPREAIREPGGAAAAVAPIETLDQAQLDEWHKWIDAQPRVPDAMPPAGVKVLVLKFNDYQCPACRMTYMAYKDIIAKYEASNPEAFRYETRDFPLESECGARRHPRVGLRSGRGGAPGQGQGSRSGASSSRTGCSSARRACRATWPSRALPKLHRSTVSTPIIRKLLEAVRADVRLGQQLGVTGTPTFFVNGIRVGSLRPAYLDAAIAYLLNKT